jgi:response regulator RpfG family c-di-GMP phosphodiesterase
MEGGFFSITQAGYSLIYFALVVIALYQDPKLLNVVFKVTIIVMTIIHVIILYPLYTYADNFSNLWTFLTANNAAALIDIFLRTLVLAIFMIGLYSTVKISEDINNKRKSELLKRQAMEKDFKSVVSDVFDVITVYKQRGEDEFEKNYASNAKRIAEMAAKLGNFLGYSSKLCQEIYDYCLIHVDKQEILTLNELNEKEHLEEKDYQKIREKTIVGSVIIKRLQLDKKAEDIVRAHFEKTVNQDFIKEMNGIQNNRESQVILLSHIYDILRSVRNYKRELKHQRAIDLIRLEFYPYFDPQIVDRFLKYADDFESIYYHFT